VELPKKEFDLLFKLLSYPDRIFSKEQLLNSIWGVNAESGEETVKTHVSRLRNRLKDIPEIGITTLKGLGYKADIKKGDE
jgi:DNA-binding response OmpR family regulator